MESINPKGWNKLRVVYSNIGFIPGYCVKMRDAVKEEIDSINQYIEKISVPTGMSFYDLIKSPYTIENREHTINRNSQFNESPELTRRFVEQQMESYTNLIASKIFNDATK